jgi:hypothetical protein
MTLQEFFDKYNGKGIDFDGAYGFQCMDVYRQYTKEVVEGKQSPGVEGAKDVWDTYLTEVYTRTKNTPDNFPKPGDVVIWGTQLGPYGHIAICSSADANNLTCFGQNFPLGSVCHFQKHTYFGVLGWLRPKGLPTPPVVTPEPQIDPDKVKIDLGAEWGILEVQAIRSSLNDMKKAITDGNIERSGLQAQVKDLIESRQKLAQMLGCPDDFSAIVSEVQKLIDTEDQHNGGDVVAPGLIQWFISLFKGKR